MRLWTLHPRYLDAKGLVALWREGLLARAVLRGETRGYTRHPQLERFRRHAAPPLAIDAYLAEVHDESLRRGYRFDRSKIGPLTPVEAIDAATGQLDHEWQHLLAKLAHRAPDLHERWRHTQAPDSHPLFRLREGPVAEWERVAAPG